MLLKKGDMVRIRRGKWNADNGELGMLLNRTYLAYEKNYCRWKVLVGNEIREIWESQLFLDKQAN